MISVGIDVHKKRCQACLKDEKGRLAQELSIPNDTEGVEQLGRLLASYGEARIALESTGNLWTRFYDTLSQQGFKVVLANPYKTGTIVEARIKNDKMDARVLSDLVRADLIAESYVPSMEIREQRALLRATQKPSRGYSSRQEPRPQPARQIRPQTRVHRPIRKTGPRMASKPTTVKHRPDHPRRKPQTAPEPGRIHQQPHSQNRPGSSPTIRRETAHGVYRHRLLQRHATHQRDGTSQPVPLSQETSLLCWTRTWNKTVRRTYLPRPDNQAGQQVHTMILIEAAQNASRYNPKLKGFKLQE